MRDIFIVRAVSRLALLGEDDRYVVQVTEQCGNGDAARFDGKYLVNFHATETALEFVSHLTHYVNVNLMVKKAVHFQDVAFLYDSICQYLLLKEIHR